MHWPFVWPNYRDNKGLRHDLDREFPETQIVIRGRRRPSGKMRGPTLTMVGQDVAKAYGHHQLTRWLIEVAN